ncbi:MAG: T9SS type A sorting domain-containing protein, partial [Bacteroidota bacterium]
IKATEKALLLLLLITSLAPLRLVAQTDFTCSFANPDGSQVIACGSIVTATGIAVSAFLDNTGLFSTIKIQNNELTMYNGAKGIHTKNLNRPIIKENTVNRNVSYPTNSNWIAYCIESNRQAEIACNQANTPTAPPHSFIGRDFYISASTNTTLSCNSATGKTVRGIEFTGPSQNSIIKENLIGDHQIGLYYSNNAIVGPQPAGAVSFTNGNQWTGNYSSVAAKNENIGSISNLDDELLNLNRFRTPDIMSNSPYFPENYPDNVSGMTNDQFKWFNNYQHDPLTLCANTFCSSGGGGNGAGTGVGTGNNPLGGGVIEAVIALQATVATEYNAETRWQMQKKLMEFLLNNVEVLEHNDTLYQFYFNADYQNLKRLIQIEDTLKEAAFEATLNKLIRQQNDSLMVLLADSIQDFLEIAQDSSQTEAALFQIELLNEELNLVSSFNKLLTDQSTFKRTELMNSSLVNNQNIVPVNYNEVLEKAVNDIYFRTYGVGIDTLSFEDKNVLEQIIHLCPQAGGTAVYRARSIYELTNDSVEYRDSAVCQNVGYFRIAMQQIADQVVDNTPKSNQIIDFSLSIFPNPTKQDLNLSFSEVFSGNVIITDALGKVVHRHTITQSINLYTIDLKRLAVGVYYLYLSNDKIILNKKFIKQ